MRRTILCVALMTCFLTSCAVKSPDLLDGEPSQEKISQILPQLLEEDDAALREKVLAAFRTVTVDDTFSVAVEKNQVCTALDVTPDCAWNVGSCASALEYDYQWRAAVQRDWTDQLAEEGYVLTLYAGDGESVLQCSQGGDVVTWRLDGEDFYARAVHPENEGVFASKVYDTLLLIAQDAMSARVWDVVADGSITDLSAAAADLCVQVAENYRSVPDWVSWKPLDVQPGSVKVFDIYRGQPEQFCADIGFWVQLENAESGGAGYWQAGAGLARQGSGSMSDYWNWGLQVRVLRNPNGDWYCDDRGSGGYSVLLPESGKDGPSLEGLVDAFYLTEGFTHTWLIPYQVLERLPEQLTALPELLGQRTTEERTAMEDTLLQVLQDHAPYFPDWDEQTLRDLLGRPADV